MKNLNLDFPLWWKSETHFRQLVRDALECDENSVEDTLSIRIPFSVAVGTTNGIVSSFALVWTFYALLVIAILTIFWVFCFMIMLFHVYSVLCCILLIKIWTQINVMFEYFSVFGMHVVHFEMLENFITYLNCLFFKFLLSLDIW